MIEISTFVICLTSSGMRATIERTSPVNLAAPTSPVPVETIVIFLVCDNGAATSAATWEKQNYDLKIKTKKQKVFYLWQCFEKHFNHRSFAIFFIRLGFFQHLFSFSLCLGVDCERFSFTADFNLWRKKFKFKKVVCKIQVF